MSIPRQRNPLESLKFPEINLNLQSSVFYNLIQSRSSLFEQQYLMGIDHKKLSLQSISSTRRYCREQNAHVAFQVSIFRGPGMLHFSLFAWAFFCSNFIKSVEHFWQLSFPSIGQWVVSVPRRGQYIFWLLQWIFVPTCKKPRRIKWHMSS